MKRMSFALLLAATLSVSAQSVDVAPATPVARLIQSLAGSASSDVRNFYGPAGFAPVWTRNGVPTAQAQAAIAILENAAAKGLDPERYDGGEWASRVSVLRGDAAIASFDIELTDAVMRYSSDVRIGRVRPEQVKFALDVDSKKVYLPAFIAQVATAADVNALLASIEPQHDDYRRLLVALAKYRAANETKKVEQIELALERWRWLPARFDTPVILVNIPEFTLRARDGNDELKMRVVVGKAAGHRTPIFEGNLQHVVFRPSWSVPSSIQRKEIVPKLSRDRGWLARNRYQLVDGSGRTVGSNVDDDTLRSLRNGSLRIRQKPGTGNALGLVKFLFPNDNSVYLHSTPQQALFSRTRRDFSHGCIRLEDPAALAAWTLRSQPQWTAEKIAAAMNGKRDDVYVRVDRPIAVMILYATVVAEENGEVRFLDDIYGHDTQLARALAPKQSKGAVMVAAK